MLKCLCGQGRAGFGIASFEVPFAVCGASVSGVYLFGKICSGRTRLDEICLFFCVGTL